MSKLVFLVEEPSMADFIDRLLPRFFPGLVFQCNPHDGKQDLEKSIPRKLRAWREPGVRFVVVRDQDSADCHQVKDELIQLCRQAGRCDVLVRVVGFLSHENRSHSFRVFVEGVRRLQQTFIQTGTC